MNGFVGKFKKVITEMNGLHDQGMSLGFLYNVNLYGYGLASSGAMCSSDKDIYYYYLLIILSKYAKIKNIISK